MFSKLFEYFFWKEQDGCNKYILSFYSSCKKIRRDMKNRNKDKATRENHLFWPMDRHFHVFEIRGDSIY